MMRTLYHLPVDDREFLILTSQYQEIHEWLEARGLPFLTVSMMFHPYVRSDTALLLPDENTAFEFKVRFL